MEELVEIIFKKLSLVYGRDFTSRWEGIDLRDVKNDWMHELDGFQKAPHAIAYALKNLPEGKPPTVYEFRSIARRAPSQEAPKLDRPAANPAIVRAALDKARASLTKGLQ